MFTNYADTIENNGKSVRENNEAIEHSYAIGALVEILPIEAPLTGEDWEYTGMRLYVVALNRDCDGTPIYTLGCKNDTNPYRTIGGFGEESLVLVKA